jgi:hypothetical protein
MCTRQSVIAFKLPPQPKKMSNEGVKMDDREQAVQYSLNKDGKKHYNSGIVLRNKANYLRLPDHRFFTIFLNPST